MKLEHGKAYRTRDGRRIVVSAYESYNPPFIDEDGMTYTEAGARFHDGIATRFDLIAPWEDEPVKPQFNMAPGVFVPVENTKTRRERLATSCLQGFLSKYGDDWSPNAIAGAALEYADALIKKLDEAV